MKGGLIVISGSDVRARRIEIGVSQFKFAQLAGVTSAVLSAWELGKTAIKPDQEERILRALSELEHEVKAGTYVKPKKRGTGKAGKTLQRREYARERERRPTPPAPPGAPTVLAAFSGCGGMAEGFRMAGYSIEGFIEIVPEARATFALNFPSATCLGEDIRDVDEARLRGQLGERCIDVLAGGPPCQGFSLAGKRDKDDPRNQLFLHLLRLADIVNPKFIVMENVRLLLSMKDPNGGFVIDRILAEMADRGFDATVNVVNAQDYGVPQFRERVIIIAANRNAGIRPIYFPPPTHGDVPDGSQTILFGPSSDLLRYRTFRDATGDLAPLESGEACPNDHLHWAVDHPEHVLEWLRPVPEGMSAHDNDDPKLRPPSGYNTTYKRLRWDEPASTIGTTFGMISASRNVHPQYTRSLTVREAMRIQTFPDDFAFSGKWGPIRTMIGNAVPPMLASVLAYELKGLLSRNALQPQDLATDFVEVSGL